MKKYEKREQTTVVASTAQDFDRQVNEVLEAAALRGADVAGIDRRREGGEFLAFIETTTEVRIYETIMDSYEDRGECYHCSDCPHLLKGQDRRRRYFQCEKGMREQTRYNSPACLYFYEAYDRGEINISDIVQEKEVRHG